MEFISNKVIKNKIWGRIRQLNFWIDPTLIKSHETSRCGFLLYAHPDFTHQHDIIKILEPIAKAKLDNLRDFEFDAQPEKLNVVSGLEKISEKVVMIRSTSRQSENFQQIMTDLFAEDNTTDIQFLRKYMFVPMSIVGDVDKSTLQGLIRPQKNFRNNVYHYIITNVYKIEDKFPVVIDPESTDNEVTAMETDENGNTGSDQHLGTQDQAQAQEPNQEQYSLRDWMYDLTDTDGEPLIHAMYPSADSGKAFILCEKAKALTVLQLIHNIVDIASQVFPEQALVTYFGENKHIPLVHNHPRATEGTTTYASKLAAFATASNPQETPDSQQQTSQRNAKRNRDGKHRATNGTPTMHANAPAAVAAPTVPNYGANVDDLLAKLRTNQDNLTDIEDKQKAQDDKFQAFELQLQNLDQGLKGHGAILTALSNTQAQQGALLQNLNGKVDQLVKVISPTGMINQSQTGQLHQATSTSPNPSQGGPEGMPP